VGGTDKGDGGDRKRGEEGDHVVVMEGEVVVVVVVVVVTCAEVCKCRNEKINGGELKRSYSRRRGKPPQREGFVVGYFGIM
jgi:hypothetical protein